MAKPGGLYRRGRVDGKMKRLPLDADGADLMPIYVDVKIKEGAAWKTKTFALHTENEAVARQRALAVTGAAPRADGEAAWLSYLAELGKNAERKLGDSGASETVAPVADVWEVYVASRRRPRSSVVMLGQYKHEWEVFLEWLPDHVVSITDVTLAMGEAFVDHLELTKAGSLVKKYITTLKRTFRVVCPAMPNPFDGLATGKTEDPSLKHRPFSADEVAAIFAHAPDDLVTLLLLGYTTGWRQGDCLTVEWDGVDSKIMLDDGLLWCRPGKTRKKAKEAFAPIHPDMRTVLEIVPEDEREGYLLPELMEKYGTREKRGDLSSRIRRLYNRADVKHNKKGKATFHSFRATMQTTMDDAGVSRVITRSLLAHSGQSMSDTYSRVDVSKAADQITAALPSVLEQPDPEE